MPDQEYYKLCQQALLYPRARLFNVKNLLLYVQYVLFRRASLRPVNAIAHRRSLLSICCPSITRERSHGNTTTLPTVRRECSAANASRAPREVSGNVWATRGLILFSSASARRSSRSFPHPGNRLQTRSRPFATKSIPYTRFPPAFSPSAVPPPLPFPLALSPYQDIAILFGSTPARQPLIVCVVITTFYSIHQIIRKNRF